MRESDYYPAGAYSDPNAPYNQVDVPERDFEVTCCQTLSQTVTVTTNNYIPGAEGVDYEDGVAFSWHDDDDTSDTDWSKEYEENGYHTPLQLIQMLKEYVQKEAEQYLIDHKNDHLSGKCLPAEKHWQYKKLLKLIEECDSYEESELTFVRD